MEEHTYKEAKIWIELSLEDLNVAKELIILKHYSNAAYHAQQSSEKALKAVLCLLGENLYEHKIASYFYEIVYTNFPYPEIDEIYDNAQLLETHWVKSRYLLKAKNNTLISPLNTYNEQNSKELVNKAEIVLKKVKEFIKKEFEF